MSAAQKPTQGKLKKLFLGIKDAIWRLDFYKVEFLPFRINRNSITTKVGAILTKILLIVVLVYTITGIVALSKHSKLYLSTTKNDLSSGITFQNQYQYPFEVGFEYEGIGPIPVYVDWTQCDPAFSEQISLIYPAYNWNNWFCIHNQSDLGLDKRIRVFEFPSGYTWNITRFGILTLAIDLENYDQPFSYTGWVGETAFPFSFSGSSQSIVFSFTKQPHIIHTKRGLLFPKTNTEYGIRVSFDKVLTASANNEVMALMKSSNEYIQYTRSYDGLLDFLPGVAAIFSTLALISGLIVSSIINKQTNTVLDKNLGMVSKGALDLRAIVNNDEEMKFKDSVKENFSEKEPAKSLIPIN